MKKDLRPAYISSSSYAKKQTIPIDASLDPRLNSLTQNFKIARQNAEFVPIGLNKSFMGFLNTLQGASSGGIGQNNPVDPKDSKTNPGGDFPGYPPKGTPPLPVTNLTADYLGDDIVLTFDWDPNDSANQWIYKFKVKVHDSIVGEYVYLLANIGYDTSFLNLNSTHQTLTLKSKELSVASENPTAIDIVGVATTDIINDGAYVTANITTPWQSSLSAPILGTVTNLTDSYSIVITNYATEKAKGVYDGVMVYENFTSISSESGIDNGQWSQAMPPIDAATIYGFTPDDEPRWIRARFYQKNGGYSAYSNVVKVEPISFMPVNTNPPTQFTSGSIEWSGDDIKVNFAVPTTIPSGQSSPVQVKIKLVPYVNGSESTSLYAYYYHIIATGETSFTVKSLDLYGQFGSYYTQFKGYITSVSSQGVETSGSVISSGPITRANPLANIYPILGTPNSNNPTGLFRITPISNGYVVDFDIPAGASRLEVYEKSTAWTSVPTNDDEMVYSGLSPATVITPTNSLRYVIVRYYDKYNNTSHYSMEYTGQTSGSQVTPLDVGTLSLIENPIKIQTDGSIFSGAGGSTVYPQVFFNKDGLFAYDSSGNWTTEIINNATTNAPTFITKRAVIGDWTINPNGIQNDGYVSGSTYTGMSASGTYAFWAGADASSNSDGLAKFSVTPAGQVVARKISIIGDGTSSDLINAGGGVFKVTNTGAMTASSATITGSITVNQQSYFNANVNISSGSYLISAGTGTVKVGSEGLLAMTGSSATTKIYSSPISVTAGSTTASVSLWSKGALFGSSESSGWLISDGVIKSAHITMDSNNEYIRITGANPANGIQLAYKTGQADELVLQAGAIDSGSPFFSVSHSGTLVAQNATITGTVKSSIIKSANKTGLGDGIDGYYFNSAGDIEIKNPGATLKFANSFFDISTNGDISFTAQNPGGATDGTPADRAYTANTYGIKLGPSTNGVKIMGIPMQGNYITNAYGYSQAITQSGYYDQYGILHDTAASPTVTPYMGVSPLGAVARQRMLVEHPITGVVSLGLAVYYEDTSGVHTANPTYTSGVIGDLWVQY